MKLAPLLRQRFLDANGVPLSDGKIYSYEAESTTPLGTFANADGATNTNPIELDANGECDIWLDPTLSYKFILTDGDDNPLQTVDKITLLIDEDQLLDDSITTDKIADEAVTEAKIGDEAVTTTRIADDAITTAKILDDAVNTAKIVDDAITTDKILDENVTQGKLAQRTVTTDGTDPGVGGVSSQELTSSPYVVTGSLTAVPGLSATLTTLGRPVMVMVVPGTTGNGLQIAAVTNTLAGVEYQVKRGSTIIVDTHHSIKASISSGSAFAETPMGCLSTLDLPAAGTYTYTVLAGYTGTPTSPVLYGCKLVVWEI